jgi:molybdopterin/thiamine biosynthesis adenylyltransferase
MRMVLTDKQIERYERHVKIKPIGETGQQRLLSSRVLVIGAGGLGSPTILYLAAAGVGTLGIVDDDAVNLSNLQRQILYGTPDIGKLKTQSAKEKVERLNPDVKVVTYQEKISAANIEAVIAGYDFVVDRTDNLATKFLINDACVLGRKPFCYGGVLALHGQALTYTPGHACLRCALDVPVPLSAAPTSHELGILGAAAGVLGSILAAEAIKYLTGAGKLLTDTLLSFDLLEGQFRTTRVKRDPRCPVCGQFPTIHRPEAIRE